MELSPAHVAGQTGRLSALFRLPAPSWIDTLPGMLVVAVCCAALSAVSAVAGPPALPDPIGLGERLVLIEHLREAYGQQPPVGSTLDELRARYAAAWQAAHAPVPEADSGRADRERRLRRRVADRHGVEAADDLDEAGLVALLRRLDEQRARRDAQAIADLIAADQRQPREPAPTPAPTAPATSAPPPIVLPSAPPVAAPSSESTSTAGGPTVSRIRFTARGVADCWLGVLGERRCLLVAFGIDHNGAFGTIRQDVWERVSRAPAFTRTVLLLGHGSGSDVGGENIEGHLRANKQFYETMGGTMPAAPIECLVLASCAASNPDQMRSMRDGLGYFPTWRVATGPRSYATGFSVLAALTDVASRPAKPAWRGLYRMGTSGDDVAAFGEVGVDGERAETTYWRLIPDQATQTWKTVEQR